MLQWHYLGPMESKLGLKWLVGIVSLSTSQFPLEHVIQTLQQEMRGHGFRWLAWVREKKGQEVVKGMCCWSWNNRVFHQAGTCQRLFLRDFLGQWGLRTAFGTGAATNSDAPEIATWGEEMLESTFFRKFLGHSVNFEWDSCSVEVFRWKYLGRRGKQLPIQKLQWLQVAILVFAMGCRWVAFPTVKMNSQLGSRGWISSLASVGVSAFRFLHENRNLGRIPSFHQKKGSKFPPKKQQQ